MMPTLQATYTPTSPIASRCLPAEDADTPVTIIRRRQGWQLLDFAELWRYRELLYFLVWRDIKVRYKQAFLGVAWVVLQPLATMLVFGLFFSKLSSGGSTGAPYPLFVLCGLLPWTFFGNALGNAGQSVVASQNLVTKVYFPRLIIPLGAVGAGLVDLAVSSALLVGVLLWYGVAPGWEILLAPFFVMGLVTSALGVGTLLAALTVNYRDFRHVVPFLTQIWMFLTPSVYLKPEDSLSPTLQSILPINPAYGLILNFRVAILGGAFDLYALAVSVFAGVLLLVVGCFYFRRAERNFADVI